MKTLGTIDRPVAVASKCDALRMARRKGCVLVCIINGDHWRVWPHLNEDRLDWIDRTAIDTMPERRPRRGKR